MDNNKKPSEPVEEERWVKMEKEIKRALKDVPTGELLKELIRHDDVRILSLHHDQNGVGNIYISLQIGYFGCSEVPDSLSVNDVQDR